MHSVIPGCVWFRCVALLWGMSLDKFLVQSAPAEAFYIPEFVTEEEAMHLWAQVYSAPRHKWICLKARRLQNWGSVL